MTECSAPLSLHLPLKDEASASDFPSPTALFRTMSSTTPSTSSSAASPFGFDHRICDFSGSPGRIVFSGAGTPAYSDNTNPFFAEFEAGILRQVKANSSNNGTNSNSISTNSHSTTEAHSGQYPANDQAEDLTDWDATVRKRAFKRLSLGSSIASSASSVAPSESGEDMNDLAWDRFPMFPSKQSAGREDSVGGSHGASLGGSDLGSNQNIDLGLSEAFSQQHLAGPCSFQDHYQPVSLNGQALDDSSRPGNMTSMAPFDLEEFITPEGDEQHVQPSSNIQGLSSEPMRSANSSNGLFPNMPFISHPEQRRETSESTNGTHFSGPSETSWSSPMTPSSSSHGSVFDGASLSHQSSPYLAPTKDRSPPGTIGRSISFNGQPSAAHHAVHSGTIFQTGPCQAVNGEHRAQLTDPGLLQLSSAAKPETPARSYSTPNVLDGMSCNPAYITPGSISMSQQGSSNGLDSPFSNTSSSSIYGQALFTNGARPEFPSSPASSGFSSPLQWSAPLGGDDVNGEETYRASNYSQGMPATILTASLPIKRQPMLRSQSHHLTDLGVPLTPSPNGSSSAGQPIRQNRSNLAAATAQASPYSMFNGSASSFHSHQSSPLAMATQHGLTPVPHHPLLDLQNPYSGVITKRSRGRRVPSTPEEMTNIGKSGKVYTCKVPGCGKLFKRSEHLKRHIRSIHTDEKPFLCQICHKRFSRHDNLNQHMRVHGPTGSAGSVGGSADGSSSNAGDSPAGEDDVPSPSPSSSSNHNFVETEGGTITNRRKHQHQGLDSDVFDFELPGLHNGGADSKAMAF